MPVRVYNCEGQHIGYFHIIGEHPSLVLCDSVIYKLHPAGGLIQNPCYGELGIVNVLELDTDID